MNQIETKFCSKCKETKELALFTFQADRQQYNYACKKCVAAYCRAWRLKRAEQYKATALRYKTKNRGKIRASRVKREYGITMEEVNNLSLQQRDSCAICKTHKKELKKGLLIDHCHSTGKVRGLLCDSCNVGLGRFKDSRERLKEALKYLKGGKHVGKS